jgi:hypothetical protein
VLSFLLVVLELLLVLFSLLLHVTRSSYVCNRSHLT